MTSHLLINAAEEIKAFKQWQFENMPLISFICHKLHQIQMGKQQWLFNLVMSKSIWTSDFQMLRVWTSPDS